MADDTLMRSQEFVQRGQMQTNQIRAAASERSGRAFQQASQDIQNQSRFNQQMQRQREMDAFGQQLQMAREQRATMLAEVQAAEAEASVGFLQQKSALLREQIDTGSFADQAAHEKEMRRLQLESARFQLDQAREASDRENEDRGYERELDAARINAALGLEAYLPSDDSAIGEGDIEIPGLGIAFRNPRGKPPEQRDNFGDFAGMIRAMVEANMPTDEIEGLITSRFKNEIVGGSANPQQIQFEGDVNNLKADAKKSADSIFNKTETQLNPDMLAQARLKYLGTGPDGGNRFPDPMVKELMDAKDLTRAEAEDLVAYRFYVASLSYSQKQGR